MTDESLRAPPEATTWSVDDILRRAKAGELRIPDFQRNFVWDARDIRLLFDSIYRGYPIGNLLLWETDNTEGTTTSFASLQFEPSPRRSYVIIDGQQRIVALLGVLLDANPEDVKFRLFFDLREEAFVNPKVQRARIPKTLLPMPVAADTVQFLEWLQARHLSSNLIEAANRMVRALREYRVPVYIVRVSDKRRVREIFERMNTGGKPLGATDIFKALQRSK